MRKEFDGGASTLHMNDRGAILAARLGVADLRDAALAARGRGHKGVGATVTEGGRFNVVKTTFHRKCVGVEVLGGPFTRAEAVAFLEAL